MATRSFITTSFNYDSYQDIQTMTISGLNNNLKIDEHDCEAVIGRGEVDKKITTAPAIALYNPSCHQ